MSSQLFRRAALSAAFVSGLLAVAACAEDKTSPSMSYASGVSVITTPSETRHLSFPSQGIIRQSQIHDGDHVQAGQLLMKQDTDLDAREADRLKIEAESNSKVEAAEADLKVRQIEYDRKSKNPNAYGQEEINEAEAKLTEANKTVAVEKENKQEAVIKYDQQVLKVTKMELKCPDDVKGEWIVQKLNFNVGEMSDPQNKDGAIVVVKNDPLYVEIRGLTTMQVSTLKKGDTLQVRYVNDAPDAWKDATIDYITPVADAGADRQLVRLSLPNPDGRAAGLRMELKMTKQLQDTSPKDDGIVSFK